MKWAIASGLLLLGCVGPVEPRFESVRDAVAQRVGTPPRWVRGSEEERLVEETVRELLGKPLDLDRAVKIALIHEPGLQASFASLGVAQAEFAQASALANPRIAVGVPLPLASTGVPLVQGSFSFGFASLLTRSARRAVAEERRDSVELAVIDLVVARVAEVKGAFVSLQMELERERIAEEVDAVAAEARTLSDKRHRRGELDEREWLRQLGEAEFTHLRLTEAREATATARERLSRLLGLWGNQLGFSLTESLRGLPADDGELDGLETRAVAQRADLAAGKRRTAAVARALQAAGDYGWLEATDLGALLRVEEAGSTFVGPSVGVGLPLFDRGEATVARLRSELLRERAEVSRLAVEIRSEVRRLRAKMVAARRRTQHLREVVLPLREKLLVLDGRGDDRAPQTGVELDDQRQALAAKWALVDALGAYWLTRFELERAVGGRLP